MQGCTTETWHSLSLCYSVCYKCFFQNSPLFFIVLCQLAILHNIDWFMLIYKTLLGLSPPYLCHLLQTTSPAYNTHSAHYILLKVPKTMTALSLSSIQSLAAPEPGTICKNRLNWTGLSPSWLSRTQSCICIRMHLFPNPLILPYSCLLAVFPVQCLCAILHAINVLLIVLIFNSFISHFVLMFFFVLAHSPFPQQALPFSRPSL